MSSFQEIISSQRPVLVDFFAEWCGPCKVMAPVLKEVKNTVGENVSILKVDVDKNPQVAASFGVRGVPTLVLFRGGQVKWRRAGITPAAELVEVIRKHS